MFTSFRSPVVWIAFAYAAIIALVLYPAFYEHLGFRLSFWNCIPPTLGLIVVVRALGKSRRCLIVSAAFALLAAFLSIVVAGAWVLTPLDIRPLSPVTAIVFVFAPAYSLLAGLIGSRSGLVCNPHEIAYTGVEPGTQSPRRKD
jgi:hypothetical protein